MQPTAPAVGSREQQQSPEGATETAPDAAGDFFRPVGASPVFLITQGWRCGLHSCAASRLGSWGVVEHDAKACHGTSADPRGSSTCFPRYKKWSGRNSDSLLETHGHNRCTLVTQPKIFKTPGGVFALEVRSIKAPIVAVAVGFETKQFALMQVKKRSRAARIGALRKHFRRSLGRGNIAG